MGLFWDTFQQFQIHKRKNENGSLTERVAVLEEEIDYLSGVLRETLEKLEYMTGHDFDGDSRVPKS